MSTNYIHQWAIALGFDASAVEKGVARTTKIMNNASRAQAAAAKPYEQAIKTQNAALKEQNKLESKRQSVRRQAIAAEQAGLTQTAAMANKAIASHKDLDVLENRRLIAAKAMMEQKNRQKTIDKQMRRVEDEAYYVDRKRSKDLRNDAIQANAASRFNTRKGSMLSSVGLLEANANRVSNPEQKAMLMSKLAEARSGINNAKNHDQLTSIQSRNLKEVRAQTANLIGEQNRLNNTLAKSKWLANGVGQSFKNMARAYVSVFAAIAGVQAVFRTAKTLDSIKASMLAGAGSAEAAAESFNYVRSESKRLGLDLESTAKSYGQFSIATRQAGMDLQTTREIFEGVTEASAAFGLSADDNAGVLRALTQMVSKGVISAEELRGQMGDRMPIAMGAMAKALGMTTRELDKQMRSGNLIATETLPKWARQMKINAREGGALAAGINRIEAAQNRLNTSWTEAIEAFSGGGGKFGMVTALNELSDILIMLKPLFSVLGTVLTVAVKQIKWLLEPILAILNPTLSRIGGFKSGDSSSLGSNQPKASNVLSPLAPIASNSSSKVTNNNTINFTSTKANAKDVRKEMEDLVNLHWTGIAAGPA
jgi:tape measure domain-containing protein